MWLFRKFLPSLTVTILALTLSCNRKNPVPGCGCEGKSFKEIKNADASYVGHGGFVLFETNDTISRTLAYACEIDSTWQKSETMKSRDYIITGDLKSTCYTGESLVAIPPFLKITSIRRK